MQEASIGYVCSVVSQSWPGTTAAPPGLDQQKPDTAVPTMLPMATLKQKGSVDLPCCKLQLYRVSLQRGQTTSLQTFPSRAQYLHTSAPILQSSTPPITLADVPLFQILHLDHAPAYHTKI